MTFNWNEVTEVTHVLDIGLVAPLTEEGTIRAFSQPKLKSGQALLSNIGTKSGQFCSKIGTKSGHISLLSPNLSQSTSYQTLKIRKSGQNRECSQLGNAKPARCQKPVILDM